MPRLRLYLIYWVAFRYTRKRRMKRLRKLFEFSSEMQLLDVGGSYHIWSHVPEKPAVTIANVNPESEKRFKADNLSYEYGDGTNLQYQDSSFDLVFSNSVIEHVGDYSQQVQFAEEARRVGKGLFIQTPAREFFLEPHLLTPFIHWLPRSWQRKLIRRFSVGGLVRRWSQEQVDKFLGSIRLLSRKELETLFPDCKIIVERFLGMPRTYIAVRGIE